MIPCASSARFTLRAIPVLCGLAAVLGGCSATPSGQVAARVNDTEISDRAVEAELAAAGISQPDPGTTRAALDKVIARDLLVDQARREGIDATPDFLALRQRAEELVLADLLVKRWAAHATAPSDDRIAQFIADNPQRFEHRTIYMLDSIEIPSGPPPAAALEPLHSIDAVAALLQARNIAFQRLSQPLDSALAAPALARRLATAPPGEPIALAASGGMQVMAVVRADPAPVPAALARQLAADALRQAQIADKVAGLRSGARIAYRDAHASGAAKTN